MSKKKTSEDYNPEIVPYGNEKKLPSLAPESTGKKSAVVAHLIQTMDIAGHTNVDDIESLKNALQEYLMLCHQTNTSVTNTGMYAALGITGDTIRNWSTGKSRSTPAISAVILTCPTLPSPGSSSGWSARAF